MILIFYKFRDNIEEIFKGENLFWHLLAISSTYYLAASGLDWSYYFAFHGEVYQTFLFPAVVIGGFLPVLLPITLYIVGKIKGSFSLLNSSYAIAQAAILGSLISSTYKAFTGRIQPPFHMGELVDISRNFQFGFWRHGIFWGWPSSHTTIAFAIAVTVFILYQKKEGIRFIALFVALYIGVGVSISIHWFSDFFAGAIIGSVIGYVVGTVFYNRGELQK